MKPLLLLTFIIISYCLNAQTIDTTKIDRLHTDLDKILPKSVSLEKLPGKYKFTEGPAWNKAGGFIIFSDIPANAIYKYKTGDEPAIFLEKSGYTGTDSIFINNPGSNGLVYDKTGNLYICRHGDRTVVIMKPDKNFELIADNYQGRKLNSPNDVAVHSNGTVYFTDPPYAARGKNRVRELTFCGIFKVNKGVIELIDSTLTYPNGVALSPDEKYLYAGCSDNKNKIWKRFTLDKNGNITKEELFFDATSIPANGAPDGMKTDRKGNIYATGPGGVLIFSPQAKLLGIIKIPEGATNVAFGDTDLKTLYITARTSVYKIKTLIGGW